MPERCVNLASLVWPPEEEADDESGLGCNRDYQDLRHLTVDHVRLYLDLERQIIERIARGEDPEDVIDDVEANAPMPENPELQLEFLLRGGLMFGLDLGVASTVAALAALGCAPFSSCNGAAFGGTHVSDHPYVAFHAQPHHLPALIAAAEKADAGLGNDAIGAGAVLVYADDVETMRRFAQHLAESTTANTTFS